VRSYRYLIVGGGMTADAACRGIRDTDSQGSIGLVTAESHPPYDRPPLTKGLWQGKEESSIWRGTEELGVELALGRRIVSLDLDGRRATDDRGDEYAYERLLLATGGRPRRLPEGSADDVVYYRTYDDYKRLRELSQSGGHFVVVGGGFIGSEIAAALQTNGATVTMLFPGDGIGARLFPPALSSFVTDYYRERGVEVLPGERVHAGDPRLADAAGVVAGLGIEPSTELADATGLPVDNGIVVDTHGRVEGCDDVFAAGDVAQFPIPALGTVTRVEHEDHARSHGKAVGANMAGADTPYDHLPFFYSDLFDLGYEAVGEVDSRLETVEEWKEPGREGVVAYVDDEQRPRGFLLWNVWDKVDAARDLIRAAQPIDAAGVRDLAG
jgi:3-phenylpropionate/trans-cinnamate dioxygenase ferredoxin reductase subunit